MADLHPDANRWSAHLSGRLGSRERRRLLAHVDGCDECRQVFASLRLMTATPVRRARLAMLAAAWDTPVALVASALLVAVGVWWLGRPPLPRAPGAELASLPVMATPSPLPSRPPRIAAKPQPVPLPRALAALSPAPPPNGLLDPDTPPPAPPATIATATAADFSPVLTGFLDQGSAAGSYLQMTEASNTPIATPAANWTVGPAFAGSQTQPAVAVSFGPQPQSSSSFAWSALVQGGHVLRDVGSGVAQSVETIVPVLVPLIPGVHFLAIAHLGPKILAAGRTDQIYESSDAGAHWRQVTLPASVVPPAGVSAVRFTDPEHGLISAADGRKWLTRDGGATWTSQTSSTPVAH